MERLTDRSDGGFAYFPRCFEQPCCGYGCEIKNCDFIEKVCEKLAKFEDAEDCPTEEWIEDGYGYYHCSGCGYEYDDPETVSPYCPQCGAKMESEED